MEEDRYTRITLRIPRDLHRRLSAQADRKSHSLNAEIVAMLEYGLQLVQPKLEHSDAELRWLLKVNTANGEYQGHLSRQLHHSWSVEKFEVELHLLAAQLEDARRTGSTSLAVAIEERMLVLRHRLESETKLMLQEKSMADFSKAALDKLHSEKLQA